MPQHHNERSGGVLGWIERTGNRLPDPVFIFLYLIAALIAVSVVASSVGLSALHPSQHDASGAPQLITASSLLAPDNIRRLWADMPQTFTAFHPLGYVLVVMLGAGVAERSGLFAAAMRATVHAAPRKLLTPMVALVAMMGNLAADAAYVVLIPLAGILYAAANRHPIAGIAAAFAGVSGAFSANLLPGQLDALLFGITEAAAEALVPTWDANIVGNWYFIAGMTVVFLPVIWYVTDRVIEPRLGDPAAGVQTVDADDAGPIDALHRRALLHAGIAALAVVLLWALFLFGPGTPLLDRDGIGPARLSPFFRSLVAGFCVLFLACGWAYGRVAGTVRSHRDIVRMMQEAMAELAYYLVLAFAAAHFIAMFAWSNLGLIIAVHGAEAIRASDLPAPMLLGMIVLLTAGVNLFIGSASAKWALLAPVLVPMMMMLGISPEATTAAYRVGDGATNIVTPLMVYFPLILTFCQRWRADFGLGSLVATMLPFALALLGVGVVLTIVWIALGIPLGPAAPVHFVLP
ncbi:MAG: AbgT family transporter [Pseudomonadales bacterium]|jgi:aminobenzoyl-glutamate transport protein|nr:AbgT family transporter [Pseudomonadales bacterium]